MQDYLRLSSEVTLSLSEDDFFQLKNKDLTKFNLADRINLYYKVGNFC